MSELSSQDIAELLSFLDKKEAIFVFSLVSYQKAIEIFSDLEPSLQEFILTHFADKDIKQIIQELPYDDRIALF